jgi:hypothetical protein
MHKYSKLFEQILKERTYNWEIDPLDRSWFVDNYGKIHAEMSHRILLKRMFPKDWARLDMSDGDKEEIFTQRLIKSGWVKIGFLQDFYAIVPSMSDEVKDVLYSFCNSFLKASPEDKNALMRIMKGDSDVYQGTLKEIADDALFDF